VNITVVVPSRGRPAQARRTIQAIRATAVRPSTSIVLAVDANDPKLPAYQAMVRDLPRPLFGWDQPNLVILEPSETGDLVKATNTVSMRIAEADPDCIIGNLGDDHRPRTEAWDRRIVEALADPGIAYGDDLFQKHELPTAPFISASIVLALGWYALPTCRHLFIDNAWKDIGTLTGRLHYLPDVVIEHLHPLAGKAQWDEGYERANRRSTIEEDGAAYHYWREHYMAADVAAVQSLAVAA
jgi:hypothetical protein